MAKVDRKIYNCKIDKEKKQREKVINLVEKKIEKSKETKIEEKAYILLRKELIDTVLDKTWLTEEDLKIMRNK